MVGKRLSIMCLTAALTLLAVASGWVTRDGKSAQAAPSVMGVLYVAPGGDCGSAAPCYGSVQTAVDAAQAGDEIRIAAGVYSGVNTQGGATQVVYVAKSLTLRGGYTTADWETPDPEANVTELSAQTLGRVVYITGTNTNVTFEGLRFTYGDANGLGGHAGIGSGDAGGNLYIDRATVTLNDCHITDGAAPSSGYGGGLYIHDGALTANRTLWRTNEAGHGGAAYLYRATTHIADSHFQNNRTTVANGDGPAITVSGGAFTLSGSVIESNTAAAKAPFSGALSVNANPFLIESSVISGTVYSSGVALGGVGVLRNSRVQANEYGGVRIGDGTITLVDNEVSYNGAGKTYVEAGVYVSGTSDATIHLTHNHIHHNQNTYVSSYGGGVYIDPAPAGWVTLSDNLIEDNSVGKTGAQEDGYGGGVAINGNEVTLERNLIRNNTAIGFLHPTGNTYGGLGGGVHIRGNPILRNNVIVENHATYEGSGLYIRGAAPELYHNTIAQNAGANDATGIYVVEASSTQRAQPKLWNTIVASQTVGIYVKGDEVKNIVTAAGILWSGNVSDTWGNGTFFLSNERTGDPRFVNPAGGDYHIGPGSAALDNGVVTDVTDDVDGQVRPHYDGYDLGADEAWAVIAAKRVAPTQALPGETVTFTIVLTNTTAAPMSVRLTDTLPAQINYAGPFSYTGGSLMYTPTVFVWTGSVTPATPARIVWAGQIALDAPPGTVISNVADVQDTYGRFQTDPALIVVPQGDHYIYLPLILRNS
jgi:uncharacterized repeat protein (TIGR01451 family)